MAEKVLSAVRTIAAMALDDGMTFDSSGAAAETIREEDTYSGIRVTLGGTRCAHSAADGACRICRDCPATLGRLVAEATRRQLDSERIFDSPPERGFICRLDD